MVDVDQPITRDLHSHALALCVSGASGLGGEFSKVPNAHLSKNSEMFYLAPIAPALREGVPYNLGTS